MIFLVHFLFVWSYCEKTLAFFSPELGLVGCHAVWNTICSDMVAINGHSTFQLVPPPLLNQRII